MSEHDCHQCGHQHESEGMDNVIELTGENGETLKCEFLATVKMDEQEYIVLHALDNQEDEADNSEMIIMRMEQDGDEDYLVSIDDEDELDRAFEAFKQAAFDEYDFEDDEDFDYEEDEEDDLE